MIRSVVILGPAHPYRGGGITTFNERLARALQSQGYTVTIYNFTLQYPSFLFPGKTQYADDSTMPKDLDIKRRLNSVNPFNWFSVGNEIKNLSAQLQIRNRVFTFNREGIRNGIYFYRLTVAKDKVVTGKIVFE